MQNEAPEKTERNGVDLGHLATDISFVTRILRAHLLDMNAEFFAANDVASGHVAILNLIGLNPGVSQKNLADVVVLKKSALTKAVNELEKIGLIERRKGDGDQRFNALFLSEAGEARVAKMRAAMLASQDRIFTDIPAPERAQLFETVWKLIDGFQG